MARLCISVRMARLLQPGRFVCAWALALVMGLAVLLICPVVSPAGAWIMMRGRWARWTLAILGIELRVAGAQHLRTAGIYICNHQSLIDVVIVPALVPARARFVAKRALRLIPLWGWAFARSGALLIDRRNPRAAAQSMHEGVRRLPAGWSLVVFPEGTRSRDGALQTFKRGAFSLALESGLPLVPMALHGVRDIVPNGAWFVRGGTVHVHVGAPIAIEPRRDAGLRALIETGHAAVQACLEAARTEAQARARAA